MSFERYIELLQMLITMTDPDDSNEVLCAMNILKNLLELARSSEKANAITIRAMAQGFNGFTRLLRSKDDFAGEPGDYTGNQAKRQRLAMILKPHC